MKGKLLRDALAAFALCLAVAAPATALGISPTTEAEHNVVPPKANKEGEYIETFFETTGLTRYYKANYDEQANTTNEENDDPFSTSYETVFTHAGETASGALISYVLGPAISCPECYLAVKDGNNYPSYYLFSLAGWNGTDELNLSGFWLGNGSISHVSIWGRPDGTTNVPEPGSIALLALGLAGLAAARRRRRA